jgi:hypothetical protein
MLPFVLFFFYTRTFCVEKAKTRYRKFIRVINLLIQITNIELKWEKRSVKLFSLNMELLINERKKAQTVRHCRKKKVGANQGSNHAKVSSLSLNQV